MQQHTGMSPRWPDTSLASQSTSAWGGKGLVRLSIRLLSCRTGYCSPIRGQYSVMWYDAFSNTRLTTKCEIDNNVDCYGVIGELCVGSGKKYEGLKKEQVLLLSTTVRVKYVFQLLCQLSRLRQKASAMHNYLPSVTFQWVKGLKMALSCYGCVTIHCYDEWPGISFIWRANGGHFAVCMTWLSWRCTAPTNYPTVTQYVIQTLHNWYILVGQQSNIYTQLTRPFPPNVEVGWLNSHL